MNRTAAALGGLVVLLTAGCAPGDVGELAGDASAAWSAWGVSSYEYTLTSACGERALHGEFRVSVVDGTVAAVAPLDQTATDTLSWVPSAGEDVPTVPELLARIADAPGEVREATFDGDGIPTHVVFDPMPNAIDDEECYELTDVQPTG
jgi:hypothetical protein